MSAALRLVPWGLVALVSTVMAVDRAPLVARTPTSLASDFGDLVNLPVLTQP